MKYTAILFSVAALTACQTTTASTGGPTMLSATTGSTGDAMTGSVSTAANNGDPVTITIDGVTLAGITRTTLMDRGGFRAFMRAASPGGSLIAQEIGHSGETSTGEMTASVATSAFTSPNGLAQAATFARVGTTAMPQTGTAAFSGAYVGSWAGEEGFDNAYLVYGDATINADFGASTISGSITNRQLVAADGSEGVSNFFRDITLGTATIDSSGAFSGVATGGAYDKIVSGGVTDVSGSWSGLIGGATGNQVAGAVQLDKIYDDYVGGGLTPHVFETGVFLAE